MTAKFDNFMTALEALCREHDVAMFSTMYDGIAIWDRSKWDDQETVNGGFLEDKTE